MFYRSSLLLLALLLIGGTLPPAPAFAAKPGFEHSAPRTAERPTFKQVGTASWYGPRHQGRKTASGERFDMRRLSAAHRTLPLATVARVTNVATGKSVKVRINDRGPYVRGRVVDLSAEAARELGMAESGLGKVKIEVFASDQRRSVAGAGIGWN